MKFLATVLYEDKMSSSANAGYPLHDLVMRMVEDDINGKTWELLKLVDNKPRNGIGNLINDVRITELIAGPGKLLVLVDSDRIGEHLRLGNSATDGQVVAALEGCSNAPAKLGVFFLRPNLEGLLRAFQRCDPSGLPESMQAALRKNLNHRDMLFKEAKRDVRRSLRQCLREAQPGLDGLVKEIAVLCQRGG
jgi:hypothetical protein